MRDKLLLLGLVLIALGWSGFFEWTSRRLRGVRLRTLQNRVIGGADVAAVFALWILVDLLAMSIVGSVFAPDGFDKPGNRVWQLVAVGISRTIQIAVLPLLLNAAGVSLERIGLHVYRWKAAVAFGALQLMVWWPIITVVNAGARFYSPTIHIHPAQELIAAAPKPWEWAVLAYCLVVTAAIFEELVFRGVFQNWLRWRIGVWPAIIIAGLFFGVAHSQSWPDPVPLTLFGIGLGLVYQRTGSLLSCMTLHALFNAGNIGLSLLEGKI